MLQRIAYRSLRSLAAAPSCTICTCRCGANVLPNSGSPNNDSRRAYAYMTTRKSPSTWARERRASGQKEDDWLPENTRIFHWVIPRIEDLHVAGVMEATPHNAAGFLAEFHFAVAFGTRWAMDAKEFKQMLAKHGMNERDCLLCVRRLRSMVGGQVLRTFRKLLLSLSRIGSVEATIMQIGSTFARGKDKESIRRSLGSPQMSDSRNVLRNAAKGNNYRAMVLEGKLAMASGNEERAIELWTRAVEPALAAQGEWTVTGETRHADPLELSSPWVELMTVHHERTRVGKNEMLQCKWAMDIGCKHDDPMAHYWASTFHKRKDAQGRHSPSSNWLYHITKAAASGHKKACHELGVFYAESGWKYIEDEPPDRAKPTAFDSYSVSLSTSFLTRVWNLLGWSEPINPQDAMFQIAVFPHTAAERYHMAAAWLQEAMDYVYAPSFLFYAKMLMQEHLWDQADAPSSALEMTSKRYSWASEADHKKAEEDCKRAEADYKIAAAKAKADSRIPKATLEKAKADFEKASAYLETGNINVQERMPSEVPEGEGPPNPLYNLEGAKANLREIFYCHEAHLRFRKLGDQPDEDDEDGETSDNNMASWPYRFRKWFKYPNVRDYYVHDLEKLFLEAKGICDERGWDLYDDQGGLVYLALAKVPQQRKASFG